tara:strand:- start:5519 stop:6118 length:600 start_codon:yes stop_codon:yes gene_type:complete
MEYFVYIRTMNIYEKLVNIQGRLKAPKNQRNNFGKYNYRSCEDILEAVKPLLVEHKLTLTISDEIQGGFGDLMYVDTCAMVSDGKDNIAVRAQAGIDPNRKGMDIAQSFGSSSSYARKYALNGLFLIDDTKDADATNTHGKSTSKTNAIPKTVSQALPALKQGTEAFQKVKKALTEGFSMDEVRTRFTVSAEVEKSLLS